MNEPTPIDRSQGPTEQTKKNKGAEPDPDKFKELLKTEESDDTKKHKKQSEQFEEEFEEEINEEEIEERASIFQSFMQNDSDSSSSLYAGQESGTTRESTPSSQFEEDEYDQIFFDKKSDSSTRQEQEPLTLSTPKQNTGSIQTKMDSSTSYKKARELQQKKRDKTQDKQISQMPTIKKGASNVQNKENAELEKKKTSNLELSAAEKKKASARGVEKSGTIVSNEVPISLKPKTETTPQSELIQSKDKSSDVELTTSKKEDSSKEKEQQKQDDDNIEKKKKSSEVAEQTQELNLDVSNKAAATQQKDQPSLAKTSSGSISGVGSVASADLTKSAQTRGSPIYTTFSKSNFALFQKLVGLITVETLKGVTTTEITLNMKKSIYNGLVVRLDHYDTNPHLFNLNFFCSPEAQSALIANMAGLSKAFEQGNFSFKVNIQNPSLLKEKKIKKVVKSTKNK